MSLIDKEWFEINLEHVSSAEEFDEAMEMAHVKGFEDGFEAGEEEGYNEGIYSSVVEDKIEMARAEGWGKGAGDEQQRIHAVIKMQMKWAEEQNKGKDYIFWKNVRELLTPINFEPWSEERWQEELGEQK